MTLHWLLNVAAYSLQLVAIVGAALLVMSVTRLRAPAPALLFLQLVLLGSAFLPFVQRLAVAAPSARADVATTLTRSLSSSPIAVDTHIASTLVLLVIGGGILCRLAWLALGLMRLRGVRQRARPLTATPTFVDELMQQVGCRADIRVSDDIDSPVTIGARRPLVLLPRHALTLPDNCQRAIVCHELLHVRRRDWTHAALEELWCALLWFHPAARLLTARIALMREAVVDRQTLAITGDRRAYAHALLVFAAQTERTLTSAPALIRPRSLAQRIALLTQEVSMSRRHVTAALVIGIVLVSAAAAAVVWRFPIAPAPATIRVAAGAPVDHGAILRPGNGVSEPRIRHEVRPQYTPAAMQAKVQGSVYLDVVVDANGEPGAVTVAQSLDQVHGLDEAARQAATQWRFEPARRGDTPVPVLVTVEMTFTLR